MIKRSLFIFLINHCKIYFLIVFISFILNYRAQSSFIQIGTNLTIDTYLPYSSDAQEFIENGMDVTSKTSNNINLSITILNKNRFIWSLGLCYKHIDFRLKDRIKNWAYTSSYTGSGGTISWVNYYTFQDPADLVSKSNNFGLTNSFNFQFYEKGNFKNIIGLDLDVYLLEYYDAWYESDDITEKTNKALIPYPNNGPAKKFFLSSVSTVLFYKLIYAPSFLKNNFSLATKISLGTNLYSDWDQFKKYAWLGVGLELGFGKKPMIKKKEQ